MQTAKPDRSPAVDQVGIPAEGRAVDNRAARSVQRGRENIGQELVKCIALHGLKNLRPGAPVRQKLLQQTREEKLPRVRDRQRSRADHLEPAAAVLVVARAGRQGPRAG